MGRVGFHIRMEQDLHASVMEIAESLDMSMNGFINTILQDFVAVDEMYIMRLKIERLGSDNEITGIEFRGPSGLNAL